MLKKRFHSGWAKIQGRRLPVRGVYIYLLLRLALAMAVLATVWAPHFFHYWIDRSPVPWDVLQPSLRSPAAAVLEEVSAMSMGVSLDILNEEVVEVAEQVVSGVLPVPRFLDLPLILRGYPGDYQSGSSTLQLVMASLEVERTLIRAFEKTKDQRYLNLAIRRTLEFAAHEEQQLQGVGFLWNDHAVSARISVLTGIWRHVQEMPDLQLQSSRRILSLIQRSGRLLAKPSHFTVRTNHGIVQNLALLQIAAAFPALPESRAWRSLASERLRIQLPFYVSVEGFVLEHSAQYHLFGAELLATAVRLQFLNGLMPDASLVAAADQTRHVLGNLMRPDGSLPLVGNTSGGKGHTIPVVEKNGSTPTRRLGPLQKGPRRDISFLPVSGYAIWWNSHGPERHTQALVAWAKHEGHGHKHADEGSVLLWSDGIEWLTNTGYWPYDLRDGESAYSWTGSNSPHQLDEPADVARTVQIIAIGEAEGTRFIDIERRNNDGAMFRRQVLQLDSKTLLVLDFSQNAPLGTETVWTMDPGLDLSRGVTSNTFISSAAHDGSRLKISYTNQGNAQTQIYRGSVRPFAGWVVVNDKPNPASSLRIVDASPNSVSATLFQISESSTTIAQEISLKPGAIAQKWQLSLTGTGAVPVGLSRQDSIITLDEAEDRTGIIRTQTLALHLPPDIAHEQHELRAAYKSAVNLYPPWRDLSFYRGRSTYAIGALALLVEAGWFLWSRRVGSSTQRRVLLAHLGIAVCWAAFLIWLIWFYLV